MLSHLIQDPPGWFLWPSRPIGLYRFTQSLHVATGLASVPLLLAKLWVVLPKLFEWPPVRSIAHAAERQGLLALVGGSLFLLLSGVGNVARWRPWGFSFTSGHYWAALVAYGALLLHVGHKAAVTGRHLRRDPANPPTEPAPSAPGGHEPALSRRGFLGTVAAASGVITVTTAGQTVAWLGFLNVPASADRRSARRACPSTRRRPAPECSRPSSPTLPSPTSGWWSPGRSSATSS